jgi:tetratricopeptide (TPR) repeat protein
VTGAPPSAEVARVLAACAYGLLLSLRSEEAIARSEAAIAAAQAVGARAEEAKALRVLAISLADFGGLDRAITLVLEARRIAEEVGDAETVMDTYKSAGHLLEWAGRLRDAVEDKQEGYRRAHELGLERSTGSFVAGNLAFALLSAGRWAECEQLTRQPLASDTWGAFNLRVARGVLLARQGAFAAAEDQLDLALRLSPPFLSESAWLGQAEFALWAGRQDQAATAVTQGLRWWVERDHDDPAHPDYSLWYPLALRLEADQAEQAAARRASEEVAEARRRAAPLVAELDRLATRPPEARYPIVTATCCWLGPSSPGWRAALTPSGGARRPSRGSRWRIPSRPPMPASGRPRRCWPTAPPAPRPSRRCAAPIGRRWGSAQHRCAAKSGRWPSAAVCVLTTASTTRRPCRRWLPRPHPSA